MTTREAERLYEAQHAYRHSGLSVAIFNPHDAPMNELPVIYGFSDGGSPGWMRAVLVAQDGVCLGTHCCSSEAYMPADLGVLAGTCADRHETFRKHYPGGYRMEFVPRDEANEHSGLAAAMKLNNSRREEALGERPRENSG